LLREKASIVCRRNGWWPGAPLRGLPHSHSAPPSRAIRVSAQAAPRLVTLVDTPSLVLTPQRRPLGHGRRVGSHVRVNGSRLITAACARPRCGPTAGTATCSTAKALPVDPACGHARPETAVALMTLAVLPPVLSGAATFAILDCLAPQEFHRHCQHSLRFSLRSGAVIL
jgi:hypothetical protein